MTATALVLAFVECTGNTANLGGERPDAGAGRDGGLSIPVGAACIPSPELSTSFLGFDYHEVVLDGNNAACGAGVCLVNHFQGRASCPYGQNPSATGSDSSIGGSLRCGAGAPSSSGPCCIPGSNEAVRSTVEVGSSHTPDSEVPAQCADRPAARVVTCSCRCADTFGNTDDAGSFCTCPTGTSCEQVVPELVSGDPLAGAYCIEGPAFNPLTSCSGSLCNSMEGNCPSFDAGALPGSGALATPYFVLPVSASGVNREGCVPVLSPPAAPGANGMVACETEYVLAANDSCSTHPGLTAASPLVSSAVLAGQPAQLPVCQLAQLSPGSCASSSQPGWCYVIGSAAAANGCEQAIQISSAAALPTGATAFFVCP